MDRKELYEKIPTFAKKIMFYIPKSFLFGMDYYEYLKLIKKTERYTDSQITEYQTKKLREIAAEAYNYTDFWPEIFDKYSINPSNITLEDLKRLPTIDSSVVKANYKKMVSKRYLKKGYWVTTGGTGRNPTPIFLSNESFAIEWAFMYDQWQRIGFDWKLKKVTFRGKNLGDRLTEIVYPYNELLVNIFKLDDENIKPIVKNILDFKASFFHGYLSAIYIFTKKLEKLEIDGSKFKLKGILLGSENIDETKRNYLEEFYNCRAYSWYGHTEKGILAGECEKSRLYHAFFQYGYFMFLDKEGYNEEKGEIVTTGFINKAMPLINYKTGDYGELSNDKCSCGRNYKLLKNVKGRWGVDFIYDKNLNKIPTTAVNMHIKEQNYILNLQLYQEKPGEVEVHFSVVNDEYAGLVKASLENELKSKLGKNFIIKVLHVDDKDIFRTKSGKIPFLVQEIRDVES